MNKLFSITLPIAVDRDKVIEYLKSVNGIHFYFYFLPSSFFAYSNLNATKIHGLIKTKYPDIEYLMVIHINKFTDYSGIVPEHHLQYFNNKA